jgi:NAD(P)-dependent dehydrogenase (short-subunit alcohol dehydrogenase family)
MSNKPLAIVTGGTSGIGFGISNDLAKDYRLALVYKSNTLRAEENLEILRTHFPTTDSRLFRCDVGISDEVDRVYQKIK